MEKCSVSLIFGEMQIKAINDVSPPICQNGHDQNAWLYELTRTLARIGQYREEWGRPSRKSSRTLKNLVKGRIFGPSLLARWVRYPTLSLLWRDFCTRPETSACYGQSQGKKKKKERIFAIFKYLALLFLRTFNAFSVDSLGDAILFTNKGVPIVVQWKRI